MFKYLLLLLLLLVSAVYSQDSDSFYITPRNICTSHITKIVSFSYEINYDKGTPIYVIKPCFQYDNDSVKCEVDSILSVDPKLKKTLIISHKVHNDWIIEKVCYNCKKILIETL